ncbi:MAG: potassium/proton antiporter [Myxococcales bacterium]
MASTQVIIGFLLIAVVLAAVFLERWSVPVILVALGSGIVFGTDVLGLYDFGDVKLTNEAANLALIFILLHGGFGTKRDDMQAVALPAIGLATWGVLLTAAATFACLRFLLDWPFELALLLSVIISSTDAAAIFSILRRQSLPRKLSATVEIESAANDPMAILMTIVAVQALESGRELSVAILLEFAWKFAVGPLIGLAFARASAWLFTRLNPQDRHYYYVLFLGLVLVTYGVAESVKSSGMLAVFAAGYVLGNSKFVHKQGVFNFSAALSSVANIGMFVLMGLLVYPSQWIDLWQKGVVLFLVISLVARPVAVFLGTIGMRIPSREKTFVAWAGLRGAVPIVLATYPAAAGLSVGTEVFNLVFFAVILSVAVQGSTMGAFAKLLKLSTPSRPTPAHSLELITMAESDMDLFVVDLPDPQGAKGPRIRDLRLPDGAVITLISRGRDILVPRGNTPLEGWDQVTILAHAKDADAVRKALLEPFEEQQEEALPHGSSSAV